MRGWTFVLLLGACSSAATPSRPVASSSAAPIATRPHVVQPYELVLRGAAGAGVQRAWIEDYGSAWLRLDGEPQSSPGWGYPTPTAVAVAEVRDDRVRILHDEDDARVLVWIARDALATVTRREIGLRHDVHDAAPVRGRIGAVLAAGTIVQVTSEHDGFVVVQVVADDLYADGMLGVDAIGDTWDAVAPASEAPELTHWLAKGSHLRVAADAASSILAIAQEALPVRVHAAPRDGWLEVETAGPTIVARGHVAAAEVSAGPPSQTHGTGTGHGYGASHRISLEVPAGACLYDRIGGEVIGVNTVARTRLGHRAEEPGWWYLLVGSPWGLLDLAAHAPGPDDDPRWEVCL